ncbi:metal-dependent phosphohydrolase [Nocardiopsis exhalans]|uniref:Metal-dependent phosphohydrolase n=1 Tax=Nocardiopsis exhalans TaxID=163604 RepID=A0ABY5DDR3_9ACTN|nr:metal-dependent phosphohydrolase [Nocardiopsis exhalans]USY22080.1 metal-dependent phosphohydrolase [Nocardiopsis exhalans]
MRSFEDRPDRFFPLREEDAILLADSWKRLAGEGYEARAAGEELLGRWSESHRRYHTVSHLWSTLRAVDTLQEEARDPDAVRYAVWFHDAVYEGRPGRDEDESAALAERLLALMGKEPGLIAEVVRLVGVTKNHRPERWDANGAVVSDADLSTLAGPADEYLAYTAAVRAEYWQLADKVFRAGRLQVLRSLLEAPHLFHTPFGRAHWEPRARSNILAEVDRLTQEVPGELPPP